MVMSSTGTAPPRRSSPTPLLMRPSDTRDTTPLSSRRRNGDGIVSQPHTCARSATDAQNRRSDDLSSVVMCLRVVVKWRRAGAGSAATWMRSCVHRLGPETSYSALRLVQESSENTAVPRGRRGNCRRTRSWSLAESSSNYLIHRPGADSELSTDGTITRTNNENYACARTCSV
jgi:hypothetical protein